MGLHSKKKRIWVTFQYERGVIEALKSRVPGGRWDSGEKLWHYPLDMEVARDIRSVAIDFGWTIKVEPELATWVKAERARYAALIRPDDMTTDQATMLPRCRQERPALVAAMATKPWQIPGAQFIAGQRRVLVADQPGLGKTIQAMAAIVENNVQGPVLVIAPKSAVAVTWPEEIEQWLGKDEKFVVINADSKPAERRNKVASISSMGRTWVLVGPNYLRIRADLDDYGNYIRDKSGKKVIRVVNEGIPELFNVHWAAVIVDESHQTLAVNKGDKKKWSAQRRGLGALHIEPNGMQIAMSGTPFRGKTENLWGTLNWLQPTKYTSIWNWYRRHYGVTDSSSLFGSAIVKGDRVLDEKRFFSELKPIMVRRTKAEVAPWLPPKTYGGTHLDPNDSTSPVAVWLPMSKQQQKQYDQIVREAILNLGLEDMPVNGVLAEMVRFKQVSNSCLTAGGVKPDPTMPSNKADWIIDFLLDRQASGIKVIVASQFTSFLEMLSAQLKTHGLEHYLFTGKTSDGQRKAIRSEFQGDGDQFVLLNTKSGGVSLTLDAADDVVIVDQTWIPDDQEQVEDRAHRISRNHNVTVWNLASLGTIDEDIAILNAQREDAIVGILDRQRGVNYVKRLLAASRNRIGKAA